MMCNPRCASYELQPLLVIYWQNKIKIHAYKWQYINHIQVVSSELSFYDRRVM